MSERTCLLCDLPVPDPPISDKDIEGVFCCTGCLHVYKLLDEMDDDQAERLRRRTIERRRSEAESAEPPESAATTFMKVDGMHCSTCESFLEELLRSKAGIYKGEASYATEMVKVSYDPSRVQEEELPSLLSIMGYRARPMDSEADYDASGTVTSLIIGGFFSIIGLLLYILFLYPSYLSGSGLVPLTGQEHLFIVSNIWVMTTFVLLYTGFPILRGAWVSLSVLRPNMDLLITIAALSAYFYSAGALITGSSEVYFDVTMAIVMVVSIGNYYESKIKRNKNELLDTLMSRKIRQASVKRNGSLVSVDLDELKPGDRVLVKAGERIPIDGTVVEGGGVVNEALVTGESLPVSKDTGDKVVSGTILMDNMLLIETGSEVTNTLDDLIRLMWDQQAGRHGKQRTADTIASYFVPAVILIGLGTLFIRYLAGDTFTESLLSALAVLIVSCPCALGLATPLAVASGLRDALKRNIIFKSGEQFEDRGTMEIAALDKTGTLTTGRMELQDPGNDPDALSYAGALERFSSHPVARAIAYTNIHGSSEVPVDNFKSHDQGISGTVYDKEIYVGKPEWLVEQNFSMDDELRQKVLSGRKYGRVPVGVAWDDRVQSIIQVGDEIRDDAVDFVRRVRSTGVKVAILTGDSEAASRRLEELLEPDFLFSGARPESKTNIIGELKQLGRVAMIGDGSNDAPALAKADVGIAFGDLTAIAAESAQVVIPDDRLDKILDAFGIIRHTNRRIKQNLGWAFLYNITTIPLAIAGMINPLFAALAMAGSSLLVVVNSSRETKPR